MAQFLLWRNVVVGEAESPCSRESEGAECCEYLGQILLTSFGSVIFVIIIINTIHTVYSKFPIAAIGYKHKMVQRQRKRSLRPESSLLMEAAAGEPAPTPPSLPSCLSPCFSPLPQGRRGLSGGDPPRGAPTPTPSLADPEEAEPRKGLRGTSCSRPHTRICPPPTQGQPAPPCGSPSPPTSLNSLAFNGGGDEETEEMMEMDLPTPTRSPPQDPLYCHSYHSSSPSRSLRSRTTNSLVSPQPSLSLDSTHAAPSLVSQPSYSLASTHCIPSLISRPTPSLASSVPSQSLLSSPSASPSPSSSPSLCPSVVQQDSHPPTSEGEEEESEQEGSGDEYTPPPTIHLVTNPHLHRPLPPHEGASRLPLPSSSASASPPRPPTLGSGSPPPTSEGEEGEDSSSSQPPHPGEEGVRLRDGGSVQWLIPHSEGTPPRGHLPITFPHSIPMRGGEEQGQVNRRGPIACRHLRPQPREQTLPSPPPPSRPPRPHPSLWPKSHHQELGASVPCPRDDPRGPVGDARNRGSRFCQGRGEQQPPSPTTHF